VEDVPHESDSLPWIDACFFCLGVSSIGMSESEYHHLMDDLTLAAATALASVTLGG
jgi:hypothetical protein